MSNKNLRVALVTGGIGGIGTAICKALLKQGRKVYASHLLQETEQAQAWQKSMREDGYEVWASSQ